MATKKDKKPNPAAQALGHLGGSANTEKQNRTRAANGRHGGRPHRYQIVAKGARLTVSVRERGMTNYEIVGLIDGATLMFVGRWLLDHAPDKGVVSFDGGVGVLGNLEP